MSIPSRFPNRPGRFPNRAPSSGETLRLPEFLRPSAIVMATLAAILATGAVPAPAHAAEGGTPPGYQVLAAAPLGPGWQELPPREGQAAGAGLHAATLGLFRKADGGSVFSSGTTDWAQVLGTGRDRRVEQVTRNVLDTLLRC